MENVNNHAGSAFNDLLKALTLDSVRTGVIVLQSQATAYAWGREDGGNGRNDSYDFGMAYGILSAEYAMERRTFRPNIRDAYKRWCDNQSMAGN